jgi:GDP-mannose pyrophosphatase NudK
LTASLNNMATVQILNKETLSDKKYPLKSITFQKPDLDGNMREQQNEVYFRPDAVGVLLADKPNKTFLLTRQFRLPTYLNRSETGYLTETCAGLIDENETPEQAATREVEEETGYQVKSLNKIGGMYSSAGGITEFVHLFIADIDIYSAHEQGGGLEEEGEAIELIKITFNDALQKLKAGEFIDAKTLILLQNFFMTNGENTSDGNDSLQETK